MQNLIKAFIISAIIMVVMFITNCLIVQAFAGDVVELNQATVNYNDFFKNGRDPLVTEIGLPNRQLGKELSLQIDTNILKYFFWNNNVHGMTDEIKDSGGKGQFRMVGLKMELGMQLTNFFSFGYHHHSQHLLDHEAPFNWPVQDAVFINLILYSKHKKEGLLNW